MAVNNKSNEHQMAIIFIVECVPMSIKRDHIETIHKRMFWIECYSTTIQIDCNKTSIGNNWQLAIDRTSHINRSTQI